MNSRLSKICSVHTYILRMVVWSNVVSCFCKALYFSLMKNFEFTQKLFKSTNLFWFIAFSSGNNSLILPLTRKRMSKTVNATSNLMKSPLLVIVESVIREIIFPKRPRVSVTASETPATQKRNEVTSVSFFQEWPQRSDMSLDTGTGVVVVVLEARSISWRSWNILNKMSIVNLRQMGTLNWKEIKLYVVIIKQ